MRAVRSRLATTPILLVVVATLATGCAQLTTVNTLPPGATFYLNDGAVGTTPLEVPVRRSQLGKPLRFRIEKPGYEPHSGVLTQRIYGGRIAAAVFTLGLSLLAKWPVAPRPSYDFVLIPAATAPTAAAADTGFP
jgi:hypothetical protein